MKNKRRTNPQDSRSSWPVGIAFWLIPGVPLKLKKERKKDYQYTELYYISAVEYWTDHARSLMWNIIQHSIVRIIWKDVFTKLIWLRFFNEYCSKFRRSLDKFTCKCRNEYYIHYGLGLPKILDWASTKLVTDPLCTVMEIRFEECVAIFSRMLLHKFYFA